MPIISTIPLAAVGYSVCRPERCCATCAFSAWKRPDDGEFGVRCYLTDNYVESCGRCRKWLSREISLMAASCRSSDEFNLRKTVAGYDMPTFELDEWFSERKATSKMIALVEKMLRFRDHSTVLRSLGNENVKPGRTYLDFTEFPLMADVGSVTDDGRIPVITGTDSFYSVYGWLSENKPKYDAFLGRSCRGSIASYMI